MDAPADHDRSQLFFEWYEIHIRLTGSKARAYLSVENKPVFSQAEANYFNTEKEAYRQIRRLPKGLGVFTVERLRECIPAAPGPCHPLVKQLLDEIPLPYSLTALAWYDGADVRIEPVSCAIPMSRSTYYHHRKKLLEYGIDIGKECKVRILHRPWREPA